MSSRTENLQSAGLMTLAMAGYVVNDAFIKLAVEELPLFQSIFLRGSLIVGILLVLNGSRGSLTGLRRHVSGPVLVRLATEALSTILYLSALSRVPLAPLTAVLQIVPVAVTFVAARLLREPIDVRRVGAVTVGFVGVLLIIRPGSDTFSPWYLVGLVVVGLIVIRELATRRIASTAPSEVVALFTAVSITLMGLTLSAFEGWDAADPRSIALLAGAASFLTVGYLASVATVRVGELSFSAPFRYTVIVFSIVLQIVFFGEVPDALTFVGSTLIAAAGLFAVFSDRLPLSRRRWSLRNFSQ